MMRVCYNVRTACGRCRYNMSKLVVKGASKPCGSHALVIMSWVRADLRELL